MADKRIVDLASLVFQSSTDIYEISDATAAQQSHKESRSQQNTYWNANVQLPSSAKVTGLDAQLALKANTDGSNATGTWPINITGSSGTATFVSGIPNNVYVSPSIGINVPGNGSEHNPYQTISYAKTQITATNTNPYNIILSAEIYNENIFEFDPYIYIVGNNATIVTPNVVSEGNVTPFFGSNVYVNFYMSTFTLDCPSISVNLNGSADNQFYFFSLNEIRFVNTSSIQFTGNSDATGNTVSIKDCGNISSNTTLSLLRFSCALSGGLMGDISFSSASTSTDCSLFLDGEANFGNINVTQTSPDGSADCFIFGSISGGLVTVDGPSASLLTDVSLTQIPVLLNGATYVPATISNALNANYIPTNYSVSGVSVYDQFVGIDNALAPAPVATLQSAYDNGDGTITETGTKPFVLEDATAVDSPSNSVLLDILSTSKASKPWPQVTTVQRDLISSPANGCIIFNTDDNTLYIYNGDWVPITTSESSIFFKVANNFNELSGSNTTARGNLGFGTGILTFDLDQDYVISLPAPKEILVDMPTANHTAQLPSTTQPNSLAEGEFILIESTPTSQNMFFTVNGDPGFEINPNEVWIAVYVGSDSQNGWTFRKQSSGGGGSGDMQSAYDAGSIVQMNESQPVEFSVGSTLPQDAISLTPLYSPAFFPPPSPSRVIGMSFTMSQDGEIVGLSYADTVFSSGTRQVGLWLYLTSTTGTLLQTANVAKTDPLDSTTGKFRVASITPVTVSAGLRYVVAELNPTTDQWLGYSGPNPSFAIVDGQSQSGFTSPTLVYPPIVNLVPPGGTQWGNASLEFAATTGYTSQLTINPLSEDGAFFKVLTSDQATQPFGIGTSTQRDLISSSVLSDGYMWNNLTSHSLDRWNSVNNNWQPVCIGNLDVGTSTYTLVNNASHNIYYSGNCTLTLPTASQVDSIIEIVMASSTSLSFKIVQNSGQTIFAGSQSTTTGTLGYIQSVSPYTVIKLKTVINNNNFVVINSYGNFNVS